MAPGTRLQTRKKQYQTPILIFKLFSQPVMILDSNQTQPELIGKLVITDNPNLFPLAASILMEEDKSTIF